MLTLDQIDQMLIALANTVETLKDIRANHPDLTNEGLADVVRLLLDAEVLQRKLVFTRDYIEVANLLAQQKPS